MNGFENLDDFQNRELRKMEEIDLSCCKSGILELTGRTRAASLQGVFGVDVVDG